MMLRIPKSRGARLGLLLVALAVAAFLARVLFTAATEPSRYLTVEAHREDVEHTVLASGTIEPYTMVNVGAQVSGQLTQLHVKVGDKVHTGQLIAQIDSVPQENTLRNAEAALANVKAQRLARVAALKQAELAFERQKQMIAEDATSRETYELAEATLDTTRAEIEALDAQMRQAAITVDIAKTDLGYTRISAPISGTVVAVVTEEGRTVNANQSAPTIVLIAKLDVMKVRAEISEADITRVRAGQKVYFTILGESDKRYYATLRSVEPAPASIIDKALNTGGGGSSSNSNVAAAIYYNGLFDMPNPNGELRPSMTAQVYIVLDEARNALMIPATALGARAKDGTYTVQVLDAEGKPQPRQVRIGINNNIAVQIMHGLGEGERVVIGDAADAEKAAGERR